MARRRVRRLFVWFWPLLFVVPGIGLVRLAAGSTINLAGFEAVRERIGLVGPRQRSGLVNLQLVEPSESGFVARMPDGSQSSLTLDPRLQTQAQELLDRPGLEQSSAVLLDVNDGRVLAMAGRTETQPAAPWLATMPWAPAASVFKVITAAALVESGLPPEQKVCYHAGVHSVEADNLTEHPRLDKSCNTLGFGVSKSQNAILAKLADRHLVPSMLEDVAKRFGWNQPLDFEAATLPSWASLPSERLPFARTAAGFWSTTLSPLHGAMVAATIARGGTTPPLHVVERTQLATGEEVPLAAPTSRRVIDEQTARTVGEMMVGTTEWGTARLGFRDERGKPRLPGVRVAGKTGTLANHKPYRGYSWFVGYAPVEKPEVAVAVLLANGPRANLRAHQIAARLLQAYFHSVKVLPPTVVASR